MPEPRFRSRTFRRVKKKLPGGNTVTHYVKAKPSTTKCANCKVELKGLARERPYKIKKAGISKKRTARPFGGNLCSKCARNLIKKQSRE